MSARDSQPIKIEMFPIWFAGWLFTLGFCQLDFGRAFYAIVIWPYYLGKTWFEVLQPVTQ